MWLLELKDGEISFMNMFLGGDPQFKAMDNFMEF
jgi:hypothetical protein